MLEHEPTPIPLDFATYTETRRVHMEECDFISICQLFIDRVNQIDMLSNPQFKIVELNENERTITMDFSCVVAFEYLGEREYNDYIRFINSHLSEFTDDDF